MKSYLEKLEEENQSLRAELLEVNQTLVILADDRDNWQRLAVQRSADLAISEEALSQALHTVNELSAMQMRTAEDASE